MIDASEIATLHDVTVTKWHLQEIENPYSGLLAEICQQHAFNFQLWHQEDIARSPDADDSSIAHVKRTIDKLNQQRNDWIEKVDDCLTWMVRERGVRVNPQAPINTETPGSVIDRLSILTLRIYHLNEQLQRDDADEDHLALVRRKADVCRTQHVELLEALQQLLNDIGRGRKRHRTYRQLKMYNDPTLNPYLYVKNRRAAA